MHFTIALLFTKLQFWPVHIAQLYMTLGRALRQCCTRTHAKRFGLPRRGSCRRTVPAPAASRPPITSSTMPGKSCSTMPPWSCSRPSSSSTPARQSTCGAPTPSPRRRWRWGVTAVTLPRRRTCRAPQHAAQCISFDRSYQYRLLLMEMPNPSKVVCSMAVTFPTNRVTC